MRKSDKKIENQLRISLTDVCETFLKEETGFQWLTHKVDYNKFPDSLQVICMFDTPENLAAFLKSEYKTRLITLIQTSLSDAGIPMKKPERQISFDLEHTRSGRSLH